MATYNELLKQSFPDKYGEIEKLMSYTANQKYGGVPQDWQAQIFTPLDTSNVPKTIPFTSPNQYLVKEIDSDGNTTKEYVTTDPNAGGQLLRYGKAPEGYEFIWEADRSGEQDIRTGYKKTIGDINGLPITAIYDLNGNLKSFKSSEDKRNYVSGDLSYSGSWDASGSPTPEAHTPRRGILEQLSPMLNIGAAVIGGPGAVFALNLAQGKSFKDSLKNAAISYAGQQAIGALGGSTTPELTGYDAAMADLAASTPAFTGAEMAAPITAEAITSDIAATQPAPAITPSTTEVDPYDIYGSGASQWGGNGEYVDLGAVSGTDLGGWSPATGATEAELAQARAAMAASPSLTFKQALDGVRAGLFINAIAGDPLGLGGGTPSVGGGATGFNIVPVPTEWKSPTYAPSAAPIDLESIFSNQNMLGGTQWQNLPSQNNLTFNEIFASGQQYTPMGTPVDINQIVGSILGQTTTG